MGRDAKTRRGPVLTWRGELRGTEKPCRKCGVVRPVDKFRVSKYTTVAGNPSMRVSSHCLDCEKTLKTVYYLKNIDKFKLEARKRYDSRDKEKDRIYHRNKARRRALEKFGLSPQDYERMYAAQDGKCAICMTHFARLAMDHCHSSGRVRKLLCNGCNLALGYIKERADTALRMADYINTECIKECLKPSSLQIGIAVHT
jgi:hypothetical protein